MKAAGCWHRIFCSPPGGRHRIENVCVWACFTTFVRSEKPLHTFLVLWGVNWRQKPFPQLRKCNWHRSNCWSCILWQRAYQSVCYKYYFLKSCEMTFVTSLEFPVFSRVFVAEHTRGSSFQCRRGTTPVPTHEPIQHLCSHWPVWAEEAGDGDEIAPVPGALFLLSLSHHGVDMLLTWDLLLLFPLWNHHVILQLAAAHEAVKLWILPVLCPFPIIFILCACVNMGSSHT